MTEPKTQTEPQLNKRALKSKCLNAYSEELQHSGVVIEPTEKVAYKNGFDDGWQSAMDYSQSDGERWNAYLCELSEAWEFSKGSDDFLPKFEKWLNDRLKEFDTREGK